MSSNNHILERLRKNDPTLTKLKLVHPPETYYKECEDACDSTDELFHDLLDCLRRSTAVRYVLLERHFVRALAMDEFIRVLEAVGQMTSLREVEVWSVRVPLQELCQALKGATQLTRLGFGFVTLTGSLDASALQGHASLKTFYLSDFRLSEQEASLDSLMGALSTCAKLDFVEVFQYQQEAPPVTSKGLAALMDSQSLRHLTLRRMGLTADLTQHLSEQLAGNTHLKILNLNENNLGDAGVMALAQALSSEEGNTHALHELYLRKNQVTAVGCIQACHALQGNVGLQKLNLACNLLGDEGAVHGLAPLLEVHPTLQTLELHRTGLTDVGCQPLVQTLGMRRSCSSNTPTASSSLVHLDLSFNEITTQTYLNVALALRTNRTLQTINLQVNQKLDDAVLACLTLLSMLQSNTCLTQINTLLRVRFDPRDYARVEGLLHQINLFLKLNHAGRHRLLQGQATPEEWIRSLTVVQDDVNGLYYLLQANPALFGGS